MAEFCAQCANEMGFESDFIDPNLKPGLYNTVLCEGCGPIQTNSEGECISDDCLCKGHNVPLDKDVKYYTTNGDILLNSELSFIELSYGEWSSSMPKAYINIESLDEIPCNIGDIIFIAEEGTYTEHKIVSKSYKDGWEAALNYNLCGVAKLDKVLEHIPEDIKELFKAGWNDYFIHIT